MISETPRGTGSLRIGILGPKAADQTVGSTERPHPYSCWGERTEPEQRFLEYYTYRLVAVPRASTTHVAPRNGASVTHRGEPEHPMPHRRPRTAAPGGRSGQRTLTRGPARVTSVAAGPLRQPTGRDARAVRLRHTTCPYASRSRSGPSAVYRPRCTTGSCAPRTACHGV